MNICVVGTGYVGLVTAALFAKLGNQVWGVDVDEKKIRNLSCGEIPFYEPELKPLVLQSLKKGNLKFTNNYQQAMDKAEVVFICVGTPPKANGDYDLSYIFQSAKAIAQNLTSYTVVVIKSTVPPGTGEKVEEIIKAYTTIPFDVASCPEFLREGSAVWDSFHPSRIVIGAQTLQAKDKILKLHQKLEAPRVICDIASAQLIKYAANAFLATKISFINSIANICDKVGADVTKVSEGLGLDPRIGKSFLNAGLGYGGSCFPKDTWALISFARRLGYDFEFLKQVDKVNKEQINYFVQKVEKAFEGNIKGKILTILGLAFKPNTDDLRESRSLEVIRMLQKKGAIIRVTDPVAIKGAEKVLKRVKFYTDIYQALEGSEALLLVTEWKEYADLDFARIKRIMAKPVIIDGRNFFEGKKLKKIGFIYQGIGVS